jgi:hypothetical protein
VLEKIKEFLENNLPFDKYSRFKLKNSSCISISTSSGNENSKPFVRLTIPRWGIPIRDSLMGIPFGD